MQQKTHDQIKINKLNSITHKIQVLTLPIHSCESS